MTMNFQSVSQNERWLTLARWLLLAFVAVLIGAVAVGAVLFPGYAAQHPEEFVLAPSVWTLKTSQAALAELGWSPHIQAWFVLIRGLGGVGVGISIGLLVLWRKRDWFGWYIASTFIALGLADFNNLTIAFGDTIPGWPAFTALIIGLGWQLFFILMYMFPNGRFVPNWTRWLVPVWVTNNLLNRLFQSSVFDGVFVGLVVIAIGSQIYRYFWRADALQRQQTKWMVYALALGLILLLPANYYNLALNSGQSGADFVATLLILSMNVLLFGIWVSALAFAIFRYRLWDIDLIIRKTILYTIVSGLALGVYLLVVGATSMVLGSQQRDFVIPLVVLLAAVLLFRPLANRLERWMDRVMPLKPRPQYDDEG